MKNKEISLASSSHALDFRIDAGRGLVCELKYLDSGETLEFAVSDSVINGLAEDRFSLPFKLGVFPFFGEDASLEPLPERAEGPAFRAVCPIVGAGEGNAAIEYEFVLMQGAAPGLRVTAWFTGDTLYARCLQWMNLSVARHPFTHWTGTLYAADAPPENPPRVSGTLGELDRSLKFFDEAGLYGGSDAFIVAGCGTPVLALADGSLTLRPFPDLLGFNDDVNVFTRETPLEAFLLFKPGAECPRRTEPRAADEPEADASIRSGALCVFLRRTGGGMTLSGLSSGGEIFLENAAVPLFRAVFTDLATGRRVAVDSASGFGRIDVSQYGDVLRLAFDGCEGLPDVGFLLTARSFPSENSIEWRTEVLNGNPNASLLWLSYPELAVNRGRVDAFIPDNSGVVAADACRHARHYRQVYPAGNLAMPCFAFYRNGGGAGLYAAAHDPGGSRKDIALTTFPAAGAARLSYDCPSERMGEGANNFALPGCMAWQAFHGDWYDVATAYRRFVHACADWMPATGPEGREDTPRWMREMPFWIMDWMPNDNPDADPIPVSIRPQRPEGTPEDPDAWFHDAIALQKALGVPMGYHVYNWHWIPFNNDYPNYFPVKKGFAKGVAELQRAGIRVMPYINGQLWDMLDDRDRDVRFTSEAYPWTVKDPSGLPPAKTYAAHEPDGSLVRLAAMCPKTWFWQREMESVTQRLFEEYNVDAVYLDLIAAASPDLCYATNHGHLPGGGNWWVQGYREMMTRLNLRKPADRAFTTESNAETYADCFDGFLTWIWFEPEQVPAFPVVYAGSVAMFGRNLNGNKKRDVPYFRHHVAQQLLYGQQIGWVNADVLYYPEKLGFLSSMVRLRWELRELFASGKPLRPPQVLGAPRFRSTAGMGNPLGWKLFEASAVLAGVWRCRDGGVYVIAVNTSEEPAGCSVRYDTSEWGGAAGGVPRMVSGEGVSEWSAGKEDGAAALRLKLAGLGYAALFFPPYGREDG